MMFSLRWREGSLKKVNNTVGCIQIKCGQFLIRPFPFIQFHFFTWTMLIGSPRKVNNVTVTVPYKKIKRSVQGLRCDDYKGVNDSAYGTCYIVYNSIFWQEEKRLDETWK